jgi:hypothetical protein
VKSYKNVSDIIDLLGGNTSVAHLTSRSSNAVSNWRTFGKFPAQTFLLIKAELKRRGASAPDSLWAMQEPRRDAPVKRRRGAA